MKKVKSLSWGWGIVELQKRMSLFLVRPRPVIFGHRICFEPLNCGEIGLLEDLSADVAEPVKVVNYGPCFGVLTEEHGEVVVHRSDLITFVELEGERSCQKSMNL